MGSLCPVWQKFERLAQFAATLRLFWNLDTSRVPSRTENDSISEQGAGKVPKPQRSWRTVFDIPSSTDKPDTDTCKSRWFHLHSSGVQTLYNRASNIRFCQHLDSFHSHASLNCREKKYAKLDSGWCFSPLGQQHDRVLKDLESEHDWTREIGIESVIYI